MRHFLFITVAAVLTAGCSSHSTGLKYSDPIYEEAGFINYEYSNRGISDELALQNCHIRLRIDRPESEFTVTVAPSRLRRAGALSGTAILRARSDSSGKVISVSFLKRAGLDLDREAESIVRKMKLKPLLKQGRPLPSEVTVRVVFPGGRP